MKTLIGRHREKRIAGGRGPHFIGGNVSHRWTLAWFVLTVVGCVVINVAWDRHDVPADGCGM